MTLEGLSGEAIRHQINANVTRIIRTERGNGQASRGLPPPALASNARNSPHYASERAAGVGYCFLFFIDALPQPWPSHKCQHTTRGSTVMALKNDSLLLHLFLPLLTM